MLLNYFLILTFGFSEENFVRISFFIFFVGLVLFFTLSKSLFQPLLKSDENLQKAIKETFHEINIPVSTIDLNSKLLEKSLTDEKSLKRLKRIQQANKSLLNLYEDMEYLIKKEIEKIEEESFSLKEIISDALLEVDDIKKEITILVNVEDILITCDKRGFIKTINNLISNAVKHNIKQGEIKIDLINNILSIYNSGKTIDNKNLFLIFDDYYQEDSSKTGFGLGLSMVKEYCDKNSIIIKIEQTENGTLFKLNLNSITKKQS